VGAAVGLGRSVLVDVLEASWRAKPLCDVEEAAASSSLTRFSKAMRSRSALERNLGLLAARSASLFLLNKSSTLRGVVFGVLVVPHPFFFGGCGLKPSAN